MRANSQSEHGRRRLGRRLGSKMQENEEPQAETITNCAPRSSKKPSHEAHKTNASLSQANPFFGKAAPFLVLRLCFGIRKRKFCLGSFMDLIQTHWNLVCLVGLGIKPNYVQVCLHVKADWTLSTCFLTPKIQTQSCVHVSLRRV